jgi:hypothetical protein
MGCRYICFIRSPVVTTRSTMSKVVVPGIAPAGANCWMHGRADDPGAGADPCQGYCRGAVSVAAVLNIYRS